MTDMLYHYTTFAGFDGILRSRELWATDIQFLNDSQEFHFAFSEVLKELDRQIEGAAPETKAELSVIRKLFASGGVGSSYIVSFTRGNDQLSLWRGYSKSGGGISLGFSQSWIEKQLGQFKLFPCLYSESEQQQAIQDMLKVCLTEVASYRSKSPPHEIGTMFEGDLQIFIRDQLLGLAPRLKHPKFEEEQEWRLVLLSRSQATEDLRVRVGANTIIPYTAYPLVGRVLGVAPIQVVHFDALQCVLIGPNSHPGALLTKAVQDTFRAHKVSRHHLSFRCSSIPFRSTV